MAGCTWIGNPVLLRHFRRDEPKSMGVDEGAWNAFPFNGRHVTSHALAACASGLVMGVLLEGRSMRPVRKHRAMAVETDLIRRFD